MPPLQEPSEGDSTLEDSEFADEGENAPEYSDGVMAQESGQDNVSTLAMSEPRIMIQRPHSSRAAARQHRSFLRVNIILQYDMAGQEIPSMQLSSAATEFYMRRREAMELVSACPHVLHMTPSAPNLSLRARLNPPVSSSRASVSLLSHAGGHASRGRQHASPCGASPRHFDP